MPNPYYDADQMGLEVVSEIEQGAYYEFDTVVLWRRTADGKLFWGADSGCSCPTPFDGVDPLPLPETVRDLEQRLNDVPAGEARDFRKAAGL